MRDCAKTNQCENPCPPREVTELNSGVGDPMKTDSTQYKLRDPPKGAITVLSYKNTEFVNIVVEKSLYEKLAEKATEWKVTPDKIIYNALLLMQNSD